MKKKFVVLLVMVSQLSLFAQNDYVYVENGKLYFPNGKELSLWGVNLQPCLSWEYNDLMKKVGVPWNANEWKRITDESLDELELMKNQVIRVHLTPADFTDDKGNLVETIYLDLLDYMVAEAKERGMYMYIAFLNDMGSYQIQNSFIRQKSRDKWLYDEAFIGYSMNYISQLLKRVNPYTEQTYASDTNFTVWEIINEPDYISYSNIGSSVYNGKYTNWLTDKGLGNTEANYKLYRKELVLNYINRAYDTIRASGAQQPVVWCCNWHRMINGHEDVFEAIAESKAEVVSFCNYPGQDLVGQGYWNNPKNLTETSFSQWLANSYNKHDWYGWTRDEAFAGKAKIVYEFETFFNQSAYLYAAQAKLFRSLGVQMAAMWHYSMPEYAPYRGGSHILNLKCTPRKAGAFIVAKEIFNYVPLYDAYNTSKTTELVTDNYMFSFSKDLCIFSSDDKFYYSNSFEDKDLVSLNHGVTEIIGYGDSPYVRYNGTGLYFATKVDDSFETELLPDAEWLKEPWRYWDFKQVVTNLTEPNKEDFELSLDGEFAISSIQKKNDYGLKINQVTNNGFFIESNKMVNSVVVYNSIGQVLNQQNNVNSFSVALNMRVETGLYIVSINAEKSVKVLVP